MVCTPKLPPLPDFCAPLDIGQDQNICDGAVVLLTYATIKTIPHSAALVSIGADDAQYHKRLAVHVFHSPYRSDVRHEDGDVDTSRPAFCLRRGITNWHESSQYFQSLEERSAPLVLQESSLVACSGERFGPGVYCLPSKNDVAVHRPAAFSYDWCNRTGRQYCQTEPLCVHVPAGVKSQEAIDQVVLPMLRSHIDCANGDRALLEGYVRQLKLPDTLPGVTVRERSTLSYRLRQQRQNHVPHHTHHRTHA